LLPDAVLQFLRAAGLAGAHEMPAAAALAGGVSSDIWRVDLRDGSICVKRALSRLRVPQVWEAPVERNRYECEWFRVAGNAAPGAVPRILAQGDGVFAMEYLDAACHPVWKQQLRAGIAEPAFAAQVGARLGEIHAATAGRQSVARRFPTDALFHALRIEPYLLATATAHPDLKEALYSLARRTAQTQLCLVHGDVSPKNILAGPHGPVFLDAECAWYGDPAFDLAFCLNHLLLKCLWNPSARAGFLRCFDALASSYMAGVDWEGTVELEHRAASLLPGLLLARIDGKSPVEYITDEGDKEAVRRTARGLLAAAPESLNDLRKTWQRSLQ
jgi:aminoglycoside phosphotransferase (APT) family kinase protein